MYRKIAPVLAAVIISAMISSCSSSTPQKPSESLSPIATTEEIVASGTLAAETTTETASGENAAIWYCNGFASIGDPPFSLPEAEENPDEYFSGSYIGASRACYDSFLSGLTSDGFSIVTMKFGDFLFRDDCMVFSQYIEKDGSIFVSWYQKSPYAPNGGLSVEEAESVLMPAADESLTRIPIHPIDITPEGFFELTGGQVFAVPYYSYDKFKRDGTEQLMFEDNEWYACSVCYVIGDHSYAASMERIAVYDVDQDGSDEVLLLSAGPTYGIASFYVTCVTGQGGFDALFFPEHHYIFNFADVNGKLVIEGVSSMFGDQYFDIRIEEIDGENALLLYSGDERISGGGFLNNHTRIP